MASMAAHQEVPQSPPHSTTEPPHEPPTLTAEDIASAAGTSTPNTILLPNNVDPVIDVGWDDDPSKISPLVEGISNEEIWVLVRRLNKTVFHLKDSHRVPDGGLDLAVAPEQEFSPNKMRAQMERMYMSVVVYAMAAVKHIARLRSWNEKVRTGIFCTAYFALWALDYLIFSICMFVLALIMSPTARRILLPPAPLPLVGSLSGGVTKPNAGVLGSKDSITGAPENMKGEAVENEASNFVTALAGIALNIMSGKDPQGEPNPPEEEISGPMTADPNQLATMIASAKDKAEGVDRPSQDKSKAPMETIMWSKVRPAMHVLTVISEYAEKLANVLDPRPPLDGHLHHRLRLTGAIAPLAAVSVFLTRDLLFRSTTFVLGLLFFGRPLLDQASDWLDRQYPGWTRNISINNSLLYGVPTNPQLALALLRYGEKKKTPLPPPPRLARSPPHEPLPLSEDILHATPGDQPLGASDLELREAAAPDQDILDKAGGDDVEATKDEHSKEPHKFLQVLKGAAKGGVKGAMKLDKARAKLGNDGAKRRTGVVPGKKYEPITGPSEFHARYEGEKGYLLIDTTNSIVGTSLAFSKQSIKQLNSKPQPIWSVPISEIKELRKHSGCGFKSKLAAGWALDKDLNDSLGIVDKTGRDWAVTAIPHRDALFNRLIAIGEQTWEVW